MSYFNGRPDDFRYPKLKTWRDYVVVACTVVGTLVVMHWSGMV